MRSASRSRCSALLSILAGAATATALTGCVSTQDKAARLHVINARIVASQSAVVVTRPSRTIRVLAVSVLRTGGRVAVAVALHNLAHRAVGDIPITVGVTERSGRRLLLNGGANREYFETHLASIGAGATVTWVYTAHGTHLPHGAPFALAGDPAPSVALPAGKLPTLRVRLAPRAPSPHAGIAVMVTNLSPVPQVDLQLYAVATAGGRATAAGRAEVAELGSGRTLSTTLGLIGRADPHDVRLEAPPTLFR